MTILKKLQEKFPDKDVVFAALDELITRDQIEEFYRDYINYLKKHGEGMSMLGKPVKEDARGVAYSNICMAISRRTDYKTTSQEWLQFMNDEWKNVPKMAY